MPTPTYTALANITLGSSTSSVTFSSIPATYRDLVVIFEGVVSAGGGQVIYINFNGDTAFGNYSSVFANGDGSVTGTSTEAMRFGLVYASRSSAIANIMDYSAADKHKTYVSKYGAASNFIEMLAGRWANTSSITSLRMFLASNGFNAGSTFTLYGIEA